MSESVIDQPVTTSSDRIAVLTEALRNVAPLHGMTAEEYRWLAINGEERMVDANTALFQQGEPACRMSIILKGEIQVQRDRSSGAPVLFIGRAGQITGLLPFSRMQTYGGHGVTSAPTWAVEYDKSIFPRMLAEVPSMTQRVVSILLDRSREGTSSTTPPPLRSALPPAC
jgi:CRP-like cAMP-binding protein